MTILMERYPYRYVDTGDRGYIEKYNELAKRYVLMYECDCPLQLTTAMEDLEYTKWLDPAGVPSYRDQRGDVVRPYSV